MDHDAGHPVPLREERMGHQDALEDEGHRGTVGIELGPNCVSGADPALVWHRVRNGYGN